MEPEKCLLGKGKTSTNHQFLGSMLIFRGEFFVALQSSMCFCLEVVLQDSSIPMELQVFLDGSGRWRRLSIAFKLRLTEIYSFSHNHGSGKWLYLKVNYYWRDPFFTSMIMGGRVWTFEI